MDGYTIAVVSRLCFVHFVPGYLVKCTHQSQLKFTHAPYPSRAIILTYFLVLPFLDQEMGPHWPATLFLLLCLFLGLLLSDFQSPKAVSFSTDHETFITLMLICIKPPWQIFDLNPN